MRREGEAPGFTLVEVLIAVAIFMGAAGVLFHFAATSQRLAKAHPDAADVNQRLRVAAAMLARDLRHAGAGDAHGRLGPLVNYFPPIVPARTGALSPDSELTAFSDRISIAFVPDGGWYTELGVDMASPDVDVPINAATPGCPSGGLCGYLEDMGAAIIDTSKLGAGYDLFTVTAALGALAHGPPNSPFSLAYVRGATAVVPMVHRVYYRDAANRLMVYDGFKTTFPLVDNVVDLQFAYFVDPHPGSVALPADSLGNCAWAGGDPPASLMAPLGTATLAPMPVARFTDGPICGVSPKRFDADLLRIRRVRARIRVQAALESSRGRGGHFLNTGTADSQLSMVRDFEMTFDVTPRNMQPAR